MIFRFTYKAKEVNYFGTVIAKDIDSAEHKLRKHFMWSRLPSKNVFKICEFKSNAKIKCCII